VPSFCSSQCRLPPSLLYTIPADITTTVLKPQPITVFYTFLNGGATPLGYWVNATSHTAMKLEERFNPPTAPNSLSIITPCAYQRECSFLIITVVILVSLP
jgi:hypothetical protein